MAERKKRPVNWSELRKQVVSCEKCPRLLKHCRHIAETKRRAYQEMSYWGGPVANFGPQKLSMRLGVPLLIVGLAPGAHGANRTGRMFTGDRSGDWLFRALHKAGFANQAEAIGRRDGLKLERCVITNVCRCAPPDNRPTPAEITNCRPYLRRTLEICRPTVFLALGGLAWKAVVRYAEREKWIERPQPKFQHAKAVSLGESRFLLGSYHPSQQNTFTGRLTEEMFDNVFSIANQLIKKYDSR